MSVKMLAGGRATPVRSGNSYETGRCQHASPTTRSWTKHDRRHSHEARECHRWSKYAMNHDNQRPTKDLPLQYDLLHPFLSIPIKSGYFPSVSFCNIQTSKLPMGSWLDGRVWRGFTAPRRSWSKEIARVSRSDALQHIRWALSRKIKTQTKQNLKSN